MKFKINIIDKNVPKLELDYKSPGAACFDLTISDISYQAINKVTVKYGFRTVIPEGFKAVIVPRSSFANKGWVMTHSPGQIDSDYRGEWMSKFEAIPEGFKLAGSCNNINQGIQSLITGALQYPSFPYNIGDRVTQTYLEPVYKIPMEFVNDEDIDNTERGTGSFGSTGIN